MRFLFAIVASLFAMSLSASAVQIIGHRGAAKDAPENTLASFKLGWEQGADACELDIYLTKDGQVAVMHDANTKRTAGKDALVVEQTMAELHELSAGAWKGEQWKDERVPALSEVLALIPEGRQLFIEIKCGPEVLPALQRVIAASGKKPSQLVIISFNYEAVKQARALMPEIDAYLIASAKKEADTGEPMTIPQLIAKATAAHLTGLDLDFKFQPDAAAVAQAKAAGLKIQIWTVDDPAVAKQFAAAGVAGITTNRPGFLRAELAR